MPTYHQTLVNELILAENALRVAERQLSEVGKQPDYTAINPDASHNTKWKDTQWWPGTDITKVSEAELEERLVNRYTLMANLTEQMHSIGSSAIFGDGRTGDREKDFYALPWVDEKGNDDIAPELSQTFKDFYEEYVEYGEHDDDPELYERIIVGDFFDHWVMATPNGPMKEQEMQTFAQRRSDIAQNWKDAPDYLPEFFNAPVKDAKTVAAKGMGQGNADMAELKSSLPDGVSVKASGYGKRYGN